jgi:RNA polymerase sigma factor (sigma-70 family)
MTSRAESPPVLSDEEVVRRFQQTSDPAYFTEIFVRHRKKVYFACKAFHSESGAAEDATQETFLRVYQRIKQFSGGDFCAWLMRIAKNICIDQWRKQPAEEEAESEGAELTGKPLWTASESSPDERLVAKKVLEELKSLPFEQRRCLEMKIEGYSYEETAAQMGLSIEAVKSHLQNGRRMLWLKTERDLVRSK